MKRLLLTTALAAVCAWQAWAAPALPLTCQVVQADGTLLTILHHGDEHCHWTTTADGTLLVASGRGFYVASISDDGQLTATPQLAHEPRLREAAELTAIRQQHDRHHIFEEHAIQEATAARRASKVSSTGGYLPHTGSPRVLVILTAYKDLSFTINDPVRAFEQYLNGEEQTDLGNENNLNLCSVRKYFEQCSNGQYAPQFDIVGPVTLPDSMAYYGGGGSTGSEKLGQMARDALSLVKDQVNLRLYDNDGDGRAELVYLIFAGIGENQGGPADNMWAKVSTQNMNLGDTIRLNRVGCGSEIFHPKYPTRINGTGVFIHEFSHAMGLPDLYPTTTPGRKVNNQSMEYWDVMDNGLYTDNGYSPTPYTAWEQEAMGWIDISKLEGSGTQALSMLPLTEAGGQAYKICNQQDDREFIVVENIQQRGLNRGALGHGTLAYHVAYPNNTVNMGDSPNNRVGAPAVAVIPADSLLISGYLRSDGVYTGKEYRTSFEGDPFPGTSNNLQLSDQSALPNFRFYSTADNKVGASLLNIREDTATGIVTFYFQKDDASAVEPILLPQDDEPARTTIYDLSGRRIPSAARRPATGKTISITRGKKVVR